MAVPWKLIEHDKFHISKIEVLKKLYMINLAVGLFLPFIIKQLEFI